MAFEINGFHWCEMGLLLIGVETTPFITGFRAHLVHVQKMDSKLNFLLLASWWGTSQRIHSDKEIAIGTCPYHFLVNVMQNAGFSSHLCHQRVEILKIHLF